MTTCSPEPTFGVAALEPVETHDIERLVLVIGGHGDCGGGAFAG